MSDDFLRFEKNDRQCVLFVSGEVDLANSPHLRKTVLSALKTNPKVLVDLSAVSYIDSSGIAALVEGLQLANDRKKVFLLTNISGQVRSILELARLDQVFDIV